MLGTNLPKGSQAISFHNTLFRISELCWIKAVRLTVPEQAVRALALVLAVSWVFAMKSAKESFLNIEFLLAVFPLILAWTTAGSLKIGCTGDFEESYEGRSGMQASLFTGWIDGIRRREPDWLHLKAPHYDLLLNPHRVAWVRPCFQWKVFPLFVALIFGAYLYVVGLGFDFETYPVLDELNILIFNGGVGMVRILGYLVILTSLVAFGLSIKRSLEICGTGGVQDVFPLSAQDQASVLGILAGSETRPVSSKATVVTAEVRKPEPVSAPQAPTAALSTEQLQGPAKDA